MTYKLHIQDDEGRTTVVPILRDEITIGRKEGNTIRLTEQNVSRTHAKLVRSNGHIFIEDAGSSYGTKINGIKIHGRTTVEVGDQIQIGDYFLAIHHEEEAKAAAAAAAAKKQAPVFPTPSLSGLPIPTPTLDGTPPRREVERGGGTAIVQIDVEETEFERSADARALEGHERPHLVGLNCGFEGQVFEVPSSETILGRTDENDVMINHRSISRNHAKLALEADGSFHIYDLRSSNGIKVNEERYGKVRLQPGDTVELGHVKLRFVAPGDHYVYDPSDGGEEPAIETQPSARKGSLMLVLALFLAAGLIGVFVYLKYWPTDPKQPQTNIKKTDKDPVIIKKDPVIIKKDPVIVKKDPVIIKKDPVIIKKDPVIIKKDPVIIKKDPVIIKKDPVVIKKDPVIVKKDPVIDPVARQTQVNALLAKAATLRKQGKYAETVTELEKAKKLDPESDRVKAALSIAARESAADKRLPAIRRLVASKKYRAAWKRASTTLRSLPANSALRPKVSELRNKVKSEAANEVLTQAKTAHRAKQYDRAIRLCEDALRIDPNLAAARKLKKLALQDKKAAVKKTVVKTTPPESGDKKQKARDLYRQGKMAMINGNIDAALKSFKECLKLSPGYANAHKQLGILYGGRGKRAQACRYYKTYLRLRPNARDADAINHVIKRIGCN